MKSRELTMNLLEKSACDLLEWIKLTRSQKVDLPEDFSWYSLYSGIISRVKNLIHDGNFEGIAAWFKIINEIYDTVASGNPNSPEAEALRFEIMHIRATLIMKFGAGKAGSILDEGPLLTWFFHDLNVPLDTALQKSDDWHNIKQENKIRFLQNKEEKGRYTKQNITVEDLKTLRKIKNKLAILKPLYQHKLIENKELGDWISIMHKLP
jgi:hypothetical protein